MKIRVWNNVRKSYEYREAPHLVNGNLGEILEKLGVVKERIVRYNGKYGTDFFGQMPDGKFVQFNKDKYMKDDGTYDSDTIVYNPVNENKSNVLRDRHGDVIYPDIMIRMSYNEQYIAVGYKEDFLKTRLCGDGRTRAYFKLSGVERLF